MADVGWFIVSGSGAICAMLALALWILARPASRTARSCLLICAVGYSLAGMPVVGEAFMNRVADGIGPLEPGAVGGAPSAVVVLGSGTSTVRGWDGAHVSALDYWTAGRILEAARLYALLDPAWVVVSGGLPDPFGYDEAADSTMGRSLVDLGVPAGRIRSLPPSRNTRAEALAAAPLLKSIGVSQTILVTSRTHMRRAVGVFRAAGIRVIPAPAADLRPPASWLDRLLPGESGLSATATALHEVAGLAYYTARGWYVEEP